MIKLGIHGTRTQWICLATGVIATEKRFRGHINLNWHIPDTDLTLLYLLLRLTLAKEGSVFGDIALGTQHDRNMIDLICRNLGVALRKFGYTMHNCYWLFQNPPNTSVWLDAENITMAQNKCPKRPSRLYGFMRGQETMTWESKSMSHIINHNINDIERGMLRGFHASMP